jgi:hypothetical protein
VLTKDPETKEREKLVALIIEAVIFASLDYSEQQEAGQSCAPDHNEKRGHNLSSMTVTTEC